MSAILFDLDGVLYEGNRVIAGAADTVNWFIDNQIPHLFVTNTTSISRLELVEKLEQFGITSKADDFLTPPIAATQFLISHKLKNIALFVPAKTRTEFSEFSEVDANTKAPDAVVIGDLAECWDFETMNRVFNLLIENPKTKLIALGMTRYWRNAGQLQLDVGPMIKAFEYATDKKAIVTGKPAKAFFQAALSLLDDENEAVMIGDDIVGDVQAAQDAGLKAIQVRTGKFTEHDLTLNIKPDAVLDSIANLPQWWQQNR